MCLGYEWTLLVKSFSLGSVSDFVFNERAKSGSLTVSDNAHITLVSKSAQHTQPM